MIHRIEVAYKERVRDPRAERVAAGIRDFLRLPVQGVRTRQVFTIDADITAEEAERVRREITDEVIQVSSLDGLPAEGFDWVLAVGYRPGVTDNVGRTCKTTIEDILGRKLPDRDAVYTSCEYFLDAPGLARAEAEHIGRDLLANELIETLRVLSPAEWRAGRYRADLPVVRGETRIEVRTYRLRDADDAELMRISREGVLALNLEEMRTIRDYFADPKNAAWRRALGLGPDPTDVELETLAQTWSEHCKHKIFNARIEYTDAETGRTEIIESLFKTYIRRATDEIRKNADWVVAVFDDNAGTIAFNDRLNLVFKVETHNSPSALDPYGGAMTGIVGVNRDPFGTGLGAALLVNVWGYCLGDPFWDKPLPEGLLHPRRVRDGVHQGVIDGGNQSGIPYGVGWEVFDERYLGKPLVYCGTLGITPREINGRPSHRKAARPGDRIVMTGGRIGKDGIHGATFSSEELHAGSPTSAVQIGDPITQKKMTDFLLEARDRGLYTCITDNGAGGLASSVGEMARSSGGCEIELARAPLKYAGLQPWEILLSEAQERMTLAVPPEHIEQFLALAERREVEATVLGTFTDSGRFHVTYEGRTVACLDMDFLHEGVPTLRLKAVWKPPRHPEPAFECPADLGATLEAMLRRLNLCSGEKKARQYDHEVKGLSVLKPYQGLRDDVPGDATVFLAEPGGREGIVLARGVAPQYSDIDTYHMMANVIDEAVRRVVAVGGRLDRIAGLDNFCWPDPVQSETTPDGHYKLAQLVRANQALYDICTAYGVPCISGKDSMKNDSTRGGVKISIPPTVLFSVVGKMDDVAKAVTLDAKRPGDLVYVVGLTRPELGASEYYAHMGEALAGKRYVGNRVPQVDPERALAVYRALEQAIQEELLHSCHTPARGGLGAALARVAFGGEVGLEVDLRRVPQEAVERDDHLLFSESAGRFVVTLPPRHRERFETVMAGTPFAEVGRVLEERRLRLTGLAGKPIMEADVMALKRSWQETLADI